MANPRALVRTSLAKRLTQAMTYGLTGGFFAPEKPLNPMYPETAGRRLDYIAGYNIATRPRRDSGVDMQTLRNFAAYYDLLRILIEKRKDQICNFEWSVVPTDESKAVKSDLKDLESKAAAATEFLKFPDGHQKWNIWLRAIVEDMLVLDAITMWPVYKGNKLLRIETIDPATIKLVIDTSGRTPEPPLPAYQQILHGVPASDFTKNDLMYFMSNPASNRIYGLSKVEQILITIQIGLRRELSQLQFFTEGNVPPALAGVPDNWNAEQIAILQASFDSLLQGDTGARRKIHFVPGEVSKNIKELRSEEATLKAAFDEWVMRIMCFNMGIAPTPFINQVNRATAFTAQEEARDEGLGPQLVFIKSVMDTVIHNGLKMEGLEFKWSMEAENDPETQAGIDDKMLRNASRSVNELRQRDGLDSVAGGDEPMVYLPAGPVLLSKVAELAQPPPDDSQNPPAEGAMLPPNAPKNKPALNIKKPMLKPNTKKPDGSDLSDDKPDAALAVKKGGGAGSSGPFRQAQGFRNPGNAFHSPKAAAAQARLVKAARDHSRASRKKFVETY